MFTPVELALYGARAKAIKDLDLFNKIRPILISHRVAIEADLRKTGQGAYPPPFEVMEKLL